MLDALAALPEDPIWGLTSAFRADPRAHKIDMVIGVYRDDNGATPNMKAVRMAELALAQDSAPKTYRALAGNAVFNAGMARLVLGDAPARIARSHVIQTVGGTGALRVLGDMLASLRPDTTVWSTDPGYVNHRPIFEGAGLTLQLYRWQAKGDALDLDRVLADLAAAKPGDVVLLHGCCHNPTGANLNLAQWQAVVDVLLKTGATPMIDIAYQGFGDGLEEDAAATRLVASSVPEMLIAASCSKNFGVYRERTGILMAVTADKGLSTLTQGTLAYLNRQNYSFPPDHGARLVTMILNDDALRADWAAELEEVRLSMLGLRQQLADELRKLTGSDQFGFIAQHRGMFSRLGVSPEVVSQLRDDHAIYAVGDSRINIAGLNKETVPALAKALHKCGV